MRGIFLCLGIFTLLESVITINMAEFQAIGYFKQRKGGYYLIASLLYLLVAVINFILFFLIKF